MPEVQSPCQLFIITGLINGVLNSTNYAASNCINIREQRTGKDTEVVVARFEQQYSLGGPETLIVRSISNRRTSDFPPGNPVSGVARSAED
jgi:hypothetical protein